MAVDGEGVGGSTRRRQLAAPPSCAHSGTARWDRDSVIQAVREWGLLTGAPPLYYEWAPREGRRRGLIGAAATRWELEAPRWPYARTATDLVGGPWREVLRAAGYEALPPLTGSVAERAEHAQHMAATGATQARIAETLGVSVSTVGKYLRAGTCEQCGNIKIEPTAAVCAQCRSNRTSSWGEPFTKEEVVEAIRAWFELEGRAPTRSDWRRKEHGGHPRWSDEFPRWPPETCVVRIFGGWTTAMAQVGLNPSRKRGWTTEETLAALQRWRGQHGAYPTSKAWSGGGGLLHPSAATVRRLFGTWGMALDRATTREDEPSGPLATGPDPRPA